MFHLLTLTIREVRPEFLNVPIRCYAWSPVEQTHGVVWLQEGATCYVVWSHSASDSRNLFYSKAAILTMKGFANSVKEYLIEKTNVII